MAKERVGCLGIVLRWFGVGRGREVAGGGLPRVQVNKYFVSDAEGDFFRVLKRVVGERGHVLAQVPLRQLLWFPGNEESNRGRGAWRNRVAAKTVDFVICHPATLRPLVAIELDEPSHARAERQRRDEQVEAMLTAAGLPWVRVITSRNYDTRELEGVVEKYLSEGRDGEQARGLHGRGGGRG